jgi:ABC-type bacteriocin/lantibiotic exporter with double-glycine peptidase domain
MVIQGETTVGVIVAFISGFDRLSAPLRELVNYYRVAAQAAVQHRMIARWM